MSSHLADFNARNKTLTANLLQRYRYHNFRKAFSNFYRRYYELVSKYATGLQQILLHGLFHSEFYGELAYKFRKNVGKPEFFWSIK